MPRKIIYFLLSIVLSIILNSCSSVKDSTQKEQQMLHEKTIDTLQHIKRINLRKGLNNFESIGEVTIKVNNDEFSGNFELGYIDKNICIVNVYGPFGINIASIELKSDTIKLANLWHKTYYQTNAKIESTELNLNFLELARKILLAEPLIDSININQNTDTLYFSNSFDKGIASYKYIISTNKLYFSYVEIEKNKLNLNYNNYKKIENSYYPYNIYIEIESLKAIISFEIEELKILKEINKYKPIDYNKLQKVDDIYKLAR